MWIRAKAPLRLGFAGGGTDVPPFPQMEGGCVLSATINMYSFATLCPLPNDQIRLRSVDFGLALNFEPQEPLLYDGKLDLVKAAIRKFGNQERGGFDLFLRSDAPPGSGLGSSSSLMVAVVGLMKEFRALSLTDYEVANLAYQLERHEVGIQGGMQDQYAAAFGGWNFIEFYEDQVIVNPLRLSQDVINELEHNLLLCFTGGTHVSGRIIEDQVQRYRMGDPQNVASLRRQKQLAVEMKNLILRRRLRELGALMDEAWEWKKKISPHITNARIDEIYAAAKQAGALGGKLNGAGGGGFMMFYCDFEKKHEVAEVLKRMGCTIRDFAFDFHGLQTWRVAPPESTAAQAGEALAATQGR